MILEAATRCVRLSAARFALVVLGIIVVSGAFATTAAGHLLCTGHANEIELLEVAAQPLDDEILSYGGLGQPPRRATVSAMADVVSARDALRAEAPAGFGVWSRVTGWHEPRCLFTFQEREREYRQRVRRRLQKTALRARGR